MTNEPILAGAEPFLFEGSEVGVLVSHGFSGTTQSMRYLGEQLHRLGGYTVLGPRLAGHGVSPQAMAATGAQDWVDSVDAALATLRARCRRVFMTGLSMGGTLTLLSAARHADLAGIVPINACVQLGTPALEIAVFDRQTPAFLGGVGSDIKQPGVTELAYAEVPLSALVQLIALCGVTRDLLPTVRCPALVLQSVEDHVVPPVNGELILHELGSADRELVRLADSYHVATLDHDKDVIVQNALAFIERLR